MIEKIKIVGPFSQVVTMRNLPLKGPLRNSQLEVLFNAGIVLNDDIIVELGDFKQILARWEKQIPDIEEYSEPMVALPGFVDPHTHICWAGSRADDYAKRLEGRSYLEIAQEGGGIWKTVTHTRSASEDELQAKTQSRATSLLHNGVTTIEVKSGYGLNAASELKILHAINKADQHVVPDLIPTCLAAHINPKDFNSSETDYLDYVINEILPEIKHHNLSNRADIYVEEMAFSYKAAYHYLSKAKEMGFSPVVHADQFTTGGSRLATEMGAVSADHLEASGENEINMLAQSSTIAVALPGASIGLAEPFAPARKLLDAGAALALGTDWNPGSAPMGDILVEASLLGVYEKLSMAEIFAAMTFRAAAALKLYDRGILSEGKKADFIAFPTNDLEEIIYNQGRIKPARIWKNGHLVYKKTWI